ncbi:MAG: J domain-containing protein [Planctomycetota bacterium]|nr:J domain-containing protein [Planctomycetota bacterium]
MSDPLEILGLPNDADDAQVRSRYLQLVREFPPDRDPERAAVIREAYEAACDSTKRLDDWLFLTGEFDTIEKLASDVRQRLRPERLSMRVLLSLADSP